MSNISGGILRLSTLKRGDSRNILCQVSVPGIIGDNYHPLTSLEGLRVVSSQKRL